MKRAISVWLFHVVCINTYILTYGHIYETYSKIIYLAAAIVVVAFCIIQVNAGFYNNLHKTLVLICLASLGCNFVFMISYFIFGMTDYKWNFCSFNTIELITAAFLLHIGKKRGLFLKESD